MKSVPSKSLDAPVFHEGTYCYAYCLLRWACLDDTIDLQVVPCIPCWVRHCFPQPFLFDFASLSIKGWNFEVMAKSCYHLSRKGSKPRQTVVAYVDPDFLCLQRCRKSCWRGFGLTSCFNLLVDGSQTLIKQGYWHWQFSCSR